MHCHSKYVLLHKVVAKHHLMQTKRWRVPTFGVRWMDNTISWKDMDGY